MLPQRFSDREGKSVGSTWLPPFRTTNAQSGDDQSTRRESPSPCDSFRSIWTYLLPALSLHCKLKAHQKQQHTPTHIYTLLTLPHRDAYPNQVTEVFIIQMTAKNLLFYGFSTFINEWATVDGPGSVFRTYGIVALVLSATSVVMCKSRSRCSLRTA
jgi:hypothetical protein